MVNDPIGDMITQIRNAGMAGKSQVILTHSRMRFIVASILQKEGYIEAVEKIDDGTYSKLAITLKMNNGTSVITGIRRVSKPGLRLYVDRHSIPKVMGGMGRSILSTSKGVMVDRDAKKIGVGGEILCEVW